MGGGTVTPPPPTVYGRFNTSLPPRHHLSGNLKQTGPLRLPEPPSLSTASPWVCFPWHS